ncbi:MAG: MoaD/ThiS family protein [Methanobacteriota archaeon]|nr:MAG: MoaD/ThiS family protein [Euryarchaeota archaeon]
MQTGERTKIVAQLLPARRETKVVELDVGETVEGLMRSLGLLPDGWIAVIDGEPVPIDHALEEDCEVRLISVVSGG